MSYRCSNHLMQKYRLIRNRKNERGLCCTYDRIIWYKNIGWTWTWVHSSVLLSYVHSQCSKCVISTHSHVSKYIMSSISVHCFLKRVFFILTKSLTFARGKVLRVSETYSTWFHFQNSIINPNIWHYEELMKIMQWKQQHEPLTAI